jgi:hypothetical protein
MGVANDRRRPPGRKNASLFVGSTSGVISFARTRDLSITGIFLETEARPAAGSTLEITLAWGDDVFSCHARVVRVADDGFALIFVDPDTFLMQALHEILDSTPTVEPSPTRP